MPSRGVGGAVARPASGAVTGAGPRLPAWSALGWFCRRKPLGAVGGALMLVVALGAVFAGSLAAYDPIETDAAHTLEPPGARHWLGSDHLGRDVYSRIVYGAGLAGRRAPLDRARLRCRWSDRSAVRIFRGQGRPSRPTRARHPSGPASPGSRAGDVGDPGPLAAERDRRDFGPDCPPGGEGPR